MPKVMDCSRDREVPALISESKAAKAEKPVLTGPDHRRACPIPWREGMQEEERWAKVRQIVREECERIESRILTVLEKHSKVKVGFINGKWTGITEEQLEAWKAAYGSCDVDNELKKMAAWIVSNPHLAPKSQYGRFINTWLARQQNVLSIRSIPTRNEQVARVCAWCSRPSTGKTNGNEHCSLHGSNAMYEDAPRVKHA